MNNFCQSTIPYCKSIQGNISFDVCKYGLLLCVTVGEGFSSGLHTAHII